MHLYKLDLEETAYVMSTARGAVQGLDSLYSQCNRAYPAACMHACIKSETHESTGRLESCIYVCTNDNGGAYINNEGMKSENLSILAVGLDKKITFLINFRKTFKTT